MASYLEQYQYTPVQPYQAPVDQIAQSYQTKLSYWVQGAARVKGAQQQILGYNLSREDNRQALSEKMKVVNQQLKNVSQMDLSLGENQSAAMSIYNPILEDNAIQADNALTTHYKNEYQKAESYKTRDKGVGYNKDNQDYLMIKLNEFATDPDRNNYAKHLNSRQGYTPYTDVTAEVKEAMKSFKPSVIETVEPILDANGKYTGNHRTVKKASSTPEDIKRYLSGVLSPQALRQMQISGTVAYNGRKDLLVRDVIKPLRDEFTRNSKDIEDLTLSLTGQDAEKTAETNAKIEALKAKNGELGQEMVDVGNGISENNFELFAGKVKMDYELGAAASAYYREDIGQKISVDQAWAINQNNANRSAIAELNAKTRIAAANIAANASRDVATINAQAKGAKAGSGDEEDPRFNGDLPITAIPGDNITNPLEDEKTATDTALIDYQSALNTFIEDIDAKNAFSTMSEENQNKFLEQKEQEFQSKRNAIENNVKTYIETYRKTFKKEPTTTEINEYRADRYTEARLEPYIKFNEARDTYGRVNRAYERGVARTDGEILNRITSGGNFDKAWTLFGDVKVNNGEKLDILKGTSKDLKIKTADGHILNDAEKVEVMNKARKLAIENPTLNDSELLNMAIANTKTSYSKVVNNQQKAYSIVNQLIDRTKTNITQDEIDLIKKLYPKFALDRTGRLNANQLRDIQKDLRFANALNKGLKVYVKNTEISVNDSDIGLFSDYKGSLGENSKKKYKDVLYTKTFKEGDGQSIKLRNSLKSYGVDDPDKYTHFQVTPEGYVYGAYFREGSQDTQYEFLATQPNLKWDPLLGLNKKFRGISNEIDAERRSGSKNVVTESFENDYGYKFRIRFINNDANPRYKIEEYNLNNPKNINGYVPMRGEYTNILQVQNAINNISIPN